MKTGNLPDIKRKVINRKATARDIRWMEVKVNDMVEIAQAEARGQKVRCCLHAGFIYFEIESFAFLQGTVLHISQGNLFLRYGVCAKEKMLDRAKAAESVIVRCAGCKVSRTTAGCGAFGRARAEFTEERQVPVLSKALVQVVVGPFNRRALVRRCLQVNKLAPVECDTASPQGE